MAGVSFPVWLLLMLGVVALSALATRASIGYAHRRQMLDLPGQRRSHQLPTPRGGGVGIVLGVVFGLLALYAFGAELHTFKALLWLLASIGLVALVGWIDDHRGLRASIRFVAHCLAALLLGWPALEMLSGFVGNPALPWVVLGALVAGGAVVWSINLHNFMDGINGLLASQALFVFIALAIICAHAGRDFEAQVIGLFAAATLGFLPFNFPRARVFMGDVGSGVLGLLVAVAIGWQIAAVPGVFECGLIAASAFMVDSTATLLSRMFSGRRWYSAHREHLYQWLVRSGFTHSQVTTLYIGWNLVVVTPALFWLCRAEGSADGAVALAMVYTLAILTWLAGKRYCLNKSHRTLRSRAP